MDYFPEIATFKSFTYPKRGFRNASGKSIIAIKIKTRYKNFYPLETLNTQ